jgi:hypothetical protein
VGGQIVVSGAGKDAKPFISPAIATGLVIVSMLSLVAYFALSAYAPDFRNDSDGGAHALSKSAVGFEGLRVLLDSADIPNAIDRGLPQHARPNPDRSMPLHPGLLILTPPAELADTVSINRLVFPLNSRPRLIILPKWIVGSDPMAFGRVLKITPLGHAAVENIVHPFSTKSRVAQRKGILPPELASLDANFVTVPEHLAPIDSLQSISGYDWTPLVVSRNGSIVLAKYQFGPLYILADPDLMNTHGLHDLPTAAFALAVIRRLREGGGPVVFDVTLNGFGRAPSLLRAAFEPPFLGATLCAILAAMLIAVHAAIRFGSPPLESTVYARGKQALATNAADMIRMLHREPHMAARYAQTTRNLVLRALGVRRQIGSLESDALFNALQRGDRASFSNLLAAAEHVNNRSDLVDLARKLYEWRQEILHAR